MVNLGVNLDVDSVEMFYHEAKGGDVHGRPLLGTGERRGVRRQQAVRGLGTAQ